MPDWAKAKTSSPRDEGLQVWIESMKRKLFGNSEDAA